MRGWILFPISLLLFWAAPVQSAELSEVALFHRCYKSLLQSRPYPDDLLLQKVRSGEQKAIEACANLLKRLDVAEGKDAVDPKDGIAKKILQVFHRLHSSWFSNKEFPYILVVRFQQTTKDLWDTTTPALYFTRSLLVTGEPLKTVMTSRHHVEPVRVPTGNGRTVFRAVTDDKLFGSIEPFAIKGELIGVREVASKVFPIFEKANGGATGTFNTATHIGGGFMGSSPYLLMNVAANYSFTADGGEKMPRNWAKAVFNDLLCRDLPAVRIEDVEALVEPKSSIPFRTTAGCTTCHATMDRAASVIRGFKYVNVMQSSGVGFNFFGLARPTEAAEAEWPTKPDPLYSRRPHRGVLYYRNYKGELVDLPVNSVAELGEALADQDDPYICAAKRYYHYFTGVDVKIGDPKFLDKKDLDNPHAKIVTQLGLSLKKHQNLKQTVIEIMNLPNYRKSDFMPY